MRIPPGMTESIASIRRNLSAIDDLIVRSTHAIREARQANRRADDLLARGPFATPWKKRERPS
jgi:hypothetical protein